MHYEHELLLAFPFSEGGKCNLCFDTSKKMLKMEVHVCHVGVVHGKIYRFLNKELLLQVKKLPLPHNSNEVSKMKLIQQLSQQDTKQKKSSVPHDVISLVSSLKKRKQEREEYSSKEEHQYQSKKRIGYLGSILAEKDLPEDKVKKTSDEDDIYSELDDSVEDPDFKNIGSEEESDSESEGSSEIDDNDESGKNNNGTVGVILPSTANKGTKDNTENKEKEKNRRQIKI